MTSPPVRPEENTVRPELVEGPSTKHLGLRGDRFAPLTYDAMTPEQRAMTDAVLAGQRGSMQGPYNVLLRSPEMGLKAQAFGEDVRFQSSLPLRLNELAILIVARDWNCDFMWQAHRKIGIEAGLSEALVGAIERREEPQGMPREEAAVVRFCRELLVGRQVNDATFAAARD